MSYPEIDVISVLGVKPFSRWDIKDKKNLLSVGRPMPHLPITKKSKNRVPRKFRRDWYFDKEWLCGSVYKQSIFCWWCTLQGSKNKIWCRDGFKDVSNATRAFAKHQESHEHVKCAIRMKYLTRSLDTEFELPSSTIIRHNHIVHLNRKIIEIFFKVTLHLARQRLEYRSHDESFGPENKGQFKKLLQLFLLECTSDIQAQYENISPDFTEDFEVVHKELIECVSQFLNSFILEEIENSNFFSIQVDDATDIGQTPQCSIIIRFVTSSGHVVERFFGFHNVSADKTPEGLFTLLHHILTPLQYQKKLVAQCYDGASVMRGELMELQEFIKYKAPTAASYVHCMALNLVLEQTTAQLSECQMFFSDLTQFSSFFDNSSKRTTLFDKIVGEHIPSVGIVATEWTSHSKLIAMIADKYSDLKVLFKKIKGNKCTDLATLRNACGMLETLNSFQFAYFVQVFKEVYEVTNPLSLTLQKKHSDIKYCMGHVKAALCLLSKKRERRLHEEMFKSAVELAGKEPEGHSVSKMTEEQKTDYFMQIFFDIIDAIKNELKERFLDFKKLNFLCLVDAANYQTAATDFPAPECRSLCEAYPTIFNMKLLQPQLHVFYLDEHFYNLSVEDTVLKMKELEVDKVLCQVYLLFTLVLTLPSTSVKVEHTFSCLKRLKTCIRHSEDWLLAHAGVFIHKNLLSELREGDPAFFKKLIDIYSSSKTGRIQLNFK